MENHNAPIKRLIKEYIERKRGCVSSARYQIKLRFTYLDWSDQKKIVQAFIHSRAASDRNWMYVQLFHIWDKSFGELIRESWERYHEERCGWIVIKYLPVEYVLQEIDRFPGERDYYYASQRLAGYPGFTIDSKRFAYTNDYLRALVLNGQEIDPADAERRLVSLIFGFCEDNLFRYNVRQLLPDKGISALDCNKIFRAVMDLEKLGCRTVVDKFYWWNERVGESVKKDLLQNPVVYNGEREVQEKLIERLKNHIKAQLDSWPSKTFISEFKINQCDSSVF